MNKVITKIKQVKTKKKKYFWTKENCRKVALKYSSRGEFSKNNRTCYSISARNKWLDDICSHMTFIKKPSGYWTFERCKEAALTCKSPKEFYEKFRTAQEISRQNNWLYDIREHMVPTGNRYKRIIYAILFEDKSVYIGLTHNVSRRYKQHITRKNCTIYKFIKDTGFQPLKCIHLTGTLSIKEAQASEKYYVEEYKNNGYSILNCVKTGAIGSSLNKWTMDKCKKEALKYNNRGEFSVKSANSYNAAVRNGWLDEICSHMIIKRRPNGYWTFDKCKESAMTCKNKEEFYKKFGGGFVVAKNKGWLNNFFPLKSS